VLSPARACSHLTSLIGSPRRPVPERRRRVHVPAPCGRFRCGRGDLSHRVKVGEEVFFGGDRRFRVLDVVVFEKEDESPFVGLLQVEAA
jgi:hypothetical protein